MYFECARKNIHIFLVMCIYYFFPVQKRAVRLGALTPLAWLRAAGLGQPGRPNRGHRPRAGQHLLRAATGGASRTQAQWRAGPPRSASPTSVAAIRCGRRVALQGQRGARDGQPGGAWVRGTPRTSDHRARWRGPVSAARLVGAAPGTPAVFTGAPRWWQQRHCPLLGGDGRAASGEGEDEGGIAA